MSGRSTNTGGVVLDLSRLSTTEVLDADSGAVRLGPGATWGRVARALAPHGLAISSGDWGDVGVGGLVTAGGIGFMGRKHGLTLEHVTATEVVLADGRIIRADADQHPDLFWALRGAGGNMGIVTALELNAAKVRDVVHSTIVVAATSPARVIERWGAVMQDAPRELTSFLYAIPQPRGIMFKAVSVFDGGDEAATQVLRRLSTIGRVLGHETQRVTYDQVVIPYDARPRGGPQRPLISNGFTSHITPALSELIAGGLEEGINDVMTFRSTGGAINDVEPGATAFAHRHQHFNLHGGKFGGIDPQRFDAHWDQLRAHLDGLYLSFETDPRPKRLRDAFPGSTLDRLQQVKAAYDPDQVFDQNFPITPAPALTAV